MTAEMLLIKKNKKNKTTNELLRVEKAENINIKSLQSARNAFDLLNKQIIRNNLFEEQHGLCAYCMRKIDKKSFNIEHYIPINQDYKKALDYNNMLGVCDGGEKKHSEDKSKFRCCDRSRDNECKLFVNPLNKNHIDSIYYLKTGEIKSSNPRIQSDLDSLNLNGQKNKDGKLVITDIDFIMGRKSAYEDYCKMLESTKPITRQKLIQLIQNEENQSVYNNYEGVILFFLKKRLERCRK